MSETNLFSFCFYYSRSGINSHVTEQGLTSYYSYGQDNLFNLKKKTGQDNCVDIYWSTCDKHLHARDGDGDAARQRATPAIEVTFGVDAARL